MAPRKKKALPRARRTGLAAAPTDSGYRWFSSYIRLEVDKKDIASITRNWIRNNFEGKKLKFMLDGPDWVYGGLYDTAAIIEWVINRGNDVPKGYDMDKVLSMYTEKVEKWATIRKEERAKTANVETTQSKVVQLSPMEKQQRAGRTLIADLEGMLDLWERHKDTNVYEKLLSENATTVGANMVLKYYTPLQAELEELINKKTPDLVEGYQHMKPKKQKELLAFVSNIISDTERYVLSKKAVRSIRKPRVKSADKQIVKLNYYKASKEYKLTSINPMSIVGAFRLYTFNTKYKQITEYVSHGPKGFEVKGSTLQHVDLEHSRTTSLRKTDVSLPIFQTKTVRQIDQHWNTLTTKTRVPNARLNKDTIILRVLDR
tara:strand:+ start:956 stop:2077 length:1122 start_codon:yes stop_codon:yes gene_type:complete